MIRKQRVFKARALALALAACICGLLSLAPAAFADTDGTELQVTECPAQLILRLGEEWVGAEFALETDAGRYPQTIPVDSDGALVMELGGSNSYTLSVVKPRAAVQKLETAIDAKADAEERTSPKESLSPEIIVQEKSDDTPYTPESPGMTQNPPTKEDGHTVGGIPKLHLILFIGGLAVSAAVLIALRVLKRRRELLDGEDDDYYEDE